MLGRSETGAVFAEYVTILALVAIGCAVATVALGTPLMDLYLYQTAILYLPIP